MLPLRHRSFSLGTLALGAALGLTALLSSRAPRALEARTANPPPAPPAARTPSRGSPAPAPRVEPAAPCLPRGVTARPTRGRALSGATLVASPAEQALAAADTDNNAVALLTMAQGAPQLRRSIATGHAPAQVLLTGDGRVFVTERGDDAVSVYDARTAQRLCSTRVARDPFGLALSADGGTLYVTSGLSQTLTALDAATLTVRATTTVRREPRGLAVAPDGRVLLAHLAGEPLSAYAVDAQGALREEPLAPVPIRPEARQRVTTFFVHSHRHFMHPLGFDTIDKARPATDEERALAAPAAAQRGARMVRRPPHGRFTRTVVERLAPRTPLPSQAWSVTIDAEREEALVPFMVNRTGRELPPTERRDVYGGGAVLTGPVEEKLSLAVGVYSLRERAWRSVSLPEGSLPSAVRTRIPTAIAPRGRGGYALVAMGSDAIATLSRVGDRVRAKATRGTVRAPCGVVALADGTEVVFSQHARLVEAHGPAGTRVVSVGGAGALEPEVARGRELFHSASDRRISSGGLSCAGCHPDGRDDGLVWFLAAGPRQTPTLAGRLEAPFNWNGTAAEMATNVRQTVRRLGGRGLPEGDVRALAAYVLRGLRAPSDAAVSEPPRDDAALVARGREVFDDDAACAGCHDAARNFTDGRAHELGGLRPDERRRAFDTPSLRYVAHTAPYFHDGRYATLRALLTDPRHRMGHVEDLSPRDVDALEAYLRTL